MITTQMNLISSSLFCYLLTRHPALVQPLSEMNRDELALLLWQAKGHALDLTLPGCEHRLATQIEV